MDDIKPCLVVHHGGMWVEDEVMYYRGGRVNVFDDIPECVDSSYVKQLIDSLGYTDIVKLHYLDPRKTMADGVRFLGFDTNTFDPFLSLLLECRVIHMYSEHEIYMTSNFNIGSGTRSVNGSGGGTFMSLLQDCHAGVGFNAPRMSEQVEYDYDSEGTDEDDVEIVSARDKLTQEKKNEFDYEEELKMLKRVADSKGKGVHMFEDDWEGVSDEDSPNDDDDEEDVGYLIPPPNLTTPRGHRSNDITTSDFNLGQVFENAVMFRKALTDYCVDSGRNIEFYRNDKNRVGAKCRQHVKGCPWKIWASWESQKRNFVVKTYIGEHKCGRAAKVSVLKSTWIARNYANWFKVNPYMKLQDIRESIWLEKGIRVSKYQAFRARKKGHASIIGEYEEQYSLLPRYAAEILKSNRGNTVKLQMTANVFERMYLCFEALKKGFKAGCRPFISLDGCFLKGPFGGQLLVAVGRDGNNQMFPLAWAVVEVESTDSWTWFLSLLGDDLETTTGAGYTFMSDQQKRLLAAVSGVFPEAETRVCARHVYCNFRGVVGGGLELRKQFWMIAKSNTENEFVKNVEVMRAISEEAAEDLMNRNYKKWCRAFYTPMSCCDSVDNNMSEVFNAYILNSRHKPIITMLEDIREGLMERLHKKRDEIGKKSILMCPRIHQRLEKIKIWARGWNAFWDGGFCYGVRKGATQDKFVVNLQARTCSCNAWQLSGIPCKHAVVSIWNKADQPEDYVNEFFTKTKYLKAYDFLLEPLNGPQEWPQSEAIVHPPKLKKVQGRPKTKRRYQAGETTASGKLRRTGQTQTCSLCGLRGHNKRGCKNAPKEREPAVQSQTTQEGPSAGTAPPNSVPMHMRGFGVYTYPNGFQRVASVPPCPRPPQHQPHTAIYTDVEGEQTVYSFSQDQYPMSSQQQSQNSNTITSQALQDLANKKRNSNK